MARKDPFRTLDDPAPGLPDGAIVANTIAAGAVQETRLAAGAVSEAQIAAGMLPAGYWRVPDGRPGWVRRFLVWLVLGWKWTK